MKIKEDEYIYYDGFIKVEDRIGRIIAHVDTLMGFELAGERYDYSIGEDLMGNTFLNAKFKHPEAEKIYYKEYKKRYKKYKKKGWDDSCAKARAAKKANRIFWEAIELKK